MARIVRRIEVPTPPDDTFAYVADFSTTEEWDPGIDQEVLTRLIINHSEKLLE